MALASGRVAGHVRECLRRRCTAGTAMIQAGGRPSGSPGVSGTPGPRAAAGHRVFVLIEMPDPFPLEYTETLAPSWPRDAVKLAW
jgi:hypothetical protein